MSEEEIKKEEIVVEPAEIVETPASPADEPSIPVEAPAETTPPESVASVVAPENLPAEPAPLVDEPTKEVEEPELVIEKIEKSAPAPVSTSAPVQNTPAPITEDFDNRFKAKLTELRAIGNIKRQKKVEENEKKILDFALANNRVDNKAVRGLTGLLDERARYYLDRLEKQGKLVQMGKKGPKVFYMPAR
jgi:hypothetical protein